MNIKFQNNDRDYDVRELTNFAHIKDTKLRAWNQLNVLTNLNEDGKNSEAYFNTLSEEDRGRLYDLGKEIDQLGVDVVHKSIVSNFTPELDEDAA